jgi:hypothetical protein
MLTALGRENDPAIVTSGVFVTVELVHAQKLSRIQLSCMRPSSSIEPAWQALYDIAAAQEGRNILVAAPESKRGCLRLKQPLPALLTSQTTCSAHEDLRVRS